MQTAVAPPLQGSYRIQSIDLLRGLVMVIMALDHVRDFFHWSAFHYDPLDFSQTTTPIFLTRWVTHFCAPVFVFLAGTSAWLTGVRKGKQALSKFLFTRGLWLVFVEVVIINFVFSFDITYSVIGLQTIWALGISMIFLSFLIYLPKRILLLLALAIIFLHNRLDNVHVDGQDAKAFLWSALHDPKFFSWKPVSIFLLYPVMSWIGVMAAGYCFGELYTTLDVAKRRRVLVLLGLACITLFIAMRFSGIYFDQVKWTRQATPIFTVLSFINTTKYPPSVLYILMTIGPAIVFLGLTEKPLKRFGNIIVTYGKVPMFYYILHFFMIHLAAVAAGLLCGYSVKEAFSLSAFNQPAGFGFHLWVVYLVWISIVALLYPLCRWYAKYKFSHPEKWWLSYL